jgi:hypothetical protein
LFWNHSTPCPNMAISDLKDTIAILATIPTTLTPCVEAKPLVRSD